MPLRRIRISIFWDIRFSGHRELRLSSRLRHWKNIRSQSTLKSGRMSLQNCIRKRVWQRNVWRNVMIWSSGSAKGSMFTKQWSWRCSTSRWRRPSRSDMTGGSQGRTVKRRRCRILPRIRRMRMSRQKIYPWRQRLRRKRLQRSLNRQRRRTGPEKKQEKRPGRKQKSRTRRRRPGLSKRSPNQRSSRPVRRKRRSKSRRSRPGRRTAEKRLHIRKRSVIRCRLMKR